MVKPVLAPCKLGKDQQFPILQLKLEIFSLHQSVGRIFFPQLLQVRIIYGQAVCSISLSGKTQPVVLDMGPLDDYYPGITADRQCCKFLAVVIIPDTGMTFSFGRTRQGGQEGRFFDLFHQRIPPPAR